MYADFLVSIGTGEMPGPFPVEVVSSPAGPAGGQMMLPEGFDDQLGGPALVALPAGLRATLVLSHGQDSGADRDREPRAAPIDATGVQPGIRILLDRTGDAGDRIQGLEERQTSGGPLHPRGRIP